MTFFVPTFKLLAFDYCTNPSTTIAFLDFSYANAIGLLNSASMCTHLNITFVVNIFTQYIHNLGTKYVVIYKYYFCYLCNILYFAIEYYCQIPIPRPYLVTMTLIGLAK